MHRLAFAAFLALIAVLSSANASDLFAPWSTAPKFHVLKTEQVDWVELSEILRSQQVWTKESVARGPDGSFSAKGWPTDVDFVWFGGVSFPARSKDGGGFVTLTTPIFNFRGPIAP